MSCEYKDSLPVGDKLRSDTPEGTDICYLALWLSQTDTIIDMQDTHFVAGTGADRFEDEEDSLSELILQGPCANCDTFGGHKMPVDEPDGGKELIPA